MDPTRDVRHRAQLIYQTEQFDGIGFVLTDSEFVALDIDDCRDPATGAIDPWAQDKIDRACSYAEVTPSKTGVRIIGLGAGDHIHSKFPVPSANGVKCEIYRDATRYITVTGAQIGHAAELGNIDPLVDETFVELGGVKRERSARTNNSDTLVDPAELRMVLGSVAPCGSSLHGCTPFLIGKRCIPLRFTSAAHAAFVTKRRPSALSTF